MSLITAQNAFKIHTYIYEFIEDTGFFITLGSTKTCSAEQRKTQEPIWNELKCLKQLNLADQLDFIALQSEPHGLSFSSPFTVHSVQGQA